MRRVERVREREKESEDSGCLQGTDRFIVGNRQHRTVHILKQKELILSINVIQ